VLTIDQDALAISRQHNHSEVSKLLERSWQKQHQSYNTGQSASKENIYFHPANIPIISVEEDRPYVLYFYLANLFFCMLTERIASYTARATVRIRVISQKVVIIIIIIIILNLYSAYYRKKKVGAKVKKIRKITINPNNWTKIVKLA